MQQPLPGLAPEPALEPAPRGLAPARDDRLALYVQGQGHSVGLKGDVLEVRNRKGVVEQVRLREVSQVSLFGNVQLSAQALRELASREITILHVLMAGGWLPSPRRRRTRTSNCAGTSFRPPAIRNFVCIWREHLSPERSATRARCCGATQPRLTVTWSTGWRRIVAKLSAPKRDHSFWASKGWLRATTSRVSRAC